MTVMAEECEVSTVVLCDGLKNALSMYALASDGRYHEWSAATAVTSRPHTTRVWSLRPGASFMHRRYGDHSLPIDTQRFGTVRPS